MVILFQQVAAIRFSNSPKMLWNFEQSISRQFINKSLVNMKYGSGGRSRMSNMFGFVGRRVFTSGNGNRRNVPKMVIIFTDGQARDRPQTKISVRKTFSSAFKIYYCVSFLPA